mmetsp:Transcript_21646/g.53476  ORF Transcript_21646/g.53476 Transcript_21646/m.53476 type:complete len:162 (-) Transcript_21646:149-634(-)
MSMTSLDVGLLTRANREMCRRNNHPRPRGRPRARDRPVRFEAAAAAEGRQSLFVTVTVKAGKMEAYEKLIKGHITECFMHDRCMYFDYGFSIDEPNKVFLYETYEDEAALQEHIVSSHLQKYMDGAALLTDLTEVRTLKLAEFGSVNCNYAGECELSGEWD